MRYVVLVLLCITLVGCGETSRDREQKAYDAGWVHIDNMEVVSVTSEKFSNGKFSSERYYVVFKHGGASYALLAKSKVLAQCLTVGGVYDLDYHSSDMLIGTIKIRE